ncbi:type I polyketide synthase [Pseudoalteromonas arctica]|uniref:SDR family NAD(P)-dependent oxidoreductase n=1 Tax=Pseudoalteromonas arctica TaxID=394751 RepID=A0A7Y0DW15_9GAMM|nr:type I polyketide synthase [Pseudoalteromonas arctica]NMM42640.1 SDR family NAD(P)-dependent oxidoreductase [Pseudoalteromonas arctica]
MKECKEHQNLNHQFAIIGMGCRFPGGCDSPDLFWRNILDGVDCISDVPKDRWDIRKFYDENRNKPSKMHTLQAGFVNQDLRTFDPLFFGISPREAEIMDPMQRMLLEVTWEAFENAGLTTQQLQNYQTGVFVGGFAIDSKTIQLDSLNQHTINSHTPMGITLALLSNRISHVFNLKGPSLTIDTACSSSVVALHYALQSMRNGDCDLAIVGGANSMMSPSYPIAMSKGQFLSPHSRCKAFDSDAAGYVRAEGAGVIIIKHLDQAILDGDNIEAVIVDSGVNQDGRTPGITLPNPISQQYLIEQVYQRSGITPNEISYIEAHGTGTKAGDPVELSAIAKAFETRNDKCFVGSVKTNIGHLEAASGVAGIIKATMTLRDKKIAPNLHFNNPNPDIPFNSIPLEVPTNIHHLEKNKVHYASVNSFGYGGANGHVLLRNLAEGELNPRLGEAVERPFYLISISAKSSLALKQLAFKYAEFIASEMNDSSECSLGDLAYTLNERRTHLTHRACFVVTDKLDFFEQLYKFASDQEHENILGEFNASNQPEISYVFSGMGPQWWKMGQELYHNSDVFRASIDEIDEVFQRVAGWSVKEQMLKEESASLMHKTEIAQPANFALQVSLSKLLESHGVYPSAIVGHSVGEVSAAYISGALTLHDACLVSFHRSRLQQKCAGLDGGMLAVGLSESDITAYLQDQQGVDIAAVNSPTSLTLAGNLSDLHVLSEKLKEAGVFYKFLRVEIAYHSEHMSEIEQELKSVLSGIKPTRSLVPLYSTVTGELISGQELDADYWWKNVRQPVLFNAVAKKLMQDNTGCFIEISAHPVLSGSLKEITSSEGKISSIVSTLSRNKPEVETFYSNLGLLHCAGVSLNWSSLAASNARFVSLPNYPWQRDYYWNETKASIEYRVGNNGYVYLNEKVDDPLETWQVEVNRYLMPYLNDHRVNDKVVFPGAGFIDAILCMHSQVFDTNHASISNVKIGSMLIVAPDELPNMRIQFDSNSNNVSICSRNIANEEASWRTNATALLLSKPRAILNTTYDLETLRSSVTKKIDVDEFYARLNKLGLQYGHYFKVIRELYTDNNRVVAKIVPVEEIENEAGDYRLHPSILDAAFQSLIMLTADDRAYVPVSVESLDLIEIPEGECWIVAELAGSNERSVFCDISALNSDGQVFFKAKNVTCTALANELPTSKEQGNCLYYPEWHVLEKGNTNTAGITSHQVVLLADNSLMCRMISETFNKLNVNYVVLNSSSTSKFEGALLDQYVETLSKSSIDDALELVPYFSPTLVLDFWSFNILKSNLDLSEIISTHCFNMRNSVLSVDDFVQGNEFKYVKFTKFAQPIDFQSENLDLSSAALIGQLPLIMNEYSNINAVSIDLDVDLSGDELLSLLDYLVAENVENEIVIRRGTKYIKRIVEKKADTLEYYEDRIESKHPIRYVNAGPHSYYEHIIQQRLKPGFVRIHVATSLLEKSDLNIDSSGFDKIKRGKFVNELSTEIIGWVTGSSCDSFAVGDQVIALCPNGGLATEVVVAKEVVHLAPASFSLTRSYCVSAFMLAYYGLIEIAQLKSNQRLLIHDVTSSIGMAALNIARKSNAQIYATVLNESLLSTASELGIKKVFSLDSFQFIDTLSEELCGSGLNLIFGSAAPEVRNLSIDLLAPFGRYIDVLEQASALTISDKNLWKNIAYNVVNMTTLFAYQTDKVGELLSKSIEYIEQNRIQALEVPIYQPDQVQFAIEELKSGKVLSHCLIKYDQETILSRIQKSRHWLTNNSTYIITGGTSGFGLDVAKQLAAWGCRKLILLSRSGGKSAEYLRELPWFENLNCQVEARAIDIADSSQVYKLFAELDNSKSPIKGIIHSAGVLHDIQLSKISKEDYQKVLRPKVEGALNLHNASLNLQYGEIETFVLFSSVSSIVGNPGQSNYVAANCFLDAFAFYRRSKGLVATTINWGALADAGMVSRDKAVAEILKQQGINTIKSEYALQQLDFAIANNDVQVGVLDVDWERWFNSNPTALKSTRLKQLKSVVSTRDLTSPYHAIYQELESLDADSRQKRFEIAIAEQVAKLLNLKTSQLSVSQSLSTLGVDSLTTNLLSVQLREMLDIRVTSMELLSGPSIAQLAKIHLEQFFGEKIIPA